MRNQFAGSPARNSFPERTPRGSGAARCDATRDARTGPQRELTSEDTDRIAAERSEALVGHSGTTVTERVYRLSYGR